MWVPELHHFKIPLSGDPTRPDRPGDMYDAETVGAEKDLGPATGVAINGINIQVSFDMGKVNTLYPGKSDFTIKSRQAFSLGCFWLLHYAIWAQYTNRAHILGTHTGQA